MKRWLIAGFVIPGPMLLFVGLMFVGHVAGQAMPSMPAAGASVEAAAEIPPVALAAYQTAAPLCPGLSWAVLAGIGKVETGHGTANGHHLDDSGQAVPTTPPLRSNVSNGALGYAYGPMQFLASTWAAYGPKVAPGLDNGDMVEGPVQNIGYAARAAALLLCANAGGSIADDVSLAKAIDAYSGSTDGYVDDVTALAALYAAGPESPAATSPPPSPPDSAGSAPMASTPPPASASGLRIVYAAIKLVGVPYANGNPAKGDPGIQYSGHPPGPWIVGYFVAHDARYATIDCSGLVNVAMKLAFDLDLNYCSDGYRTDPHFRPVPMGALAPGDLVLHGHCGLGVPGHIAIVAAYDPLTGMATIIDAARHGTVVGFRPAQNVGTWSFTTALRYTG